MDYIVHGVAESDTTEWLSLSLEHGKVGNKAQSHHQLAVWPWRNYLSSLDLKSLSYGLGNQLSHCIMKTNVWRRLLRVPWTVRRSHQSILKEVNPLNIHWKDWCWSSNTLVIWCKELTHWERPWCWERLKAGGEEGDRGGDGWMVSPTQWTWVWANSGDGKG